MSYQNIQPPAPPTQDGTGFFGALFDFSFNTFVTPKIVKVVYILATFALGIAYVVLVLAGFMQGAADPDDAGVLLLHRAYVAGHPLAPAAGVNGTGEAARQ
jgi:hypothetical protein